MPAVSCQICKSSFYAKPSHIIKGWGRYCSKSCHNESQKTGKTYACFTCEKAVYRNKKDQVGSKSGKFFCSKSCQTIWRNATVHTGNRHGNWNGGGASYRTILIKSGMVQICKKCHNNDKRILAVHHKDKDRQNNDLSNLIWLCHNCHYLVHRHKEEAEGFMVPVAQWLERRSVAADTRVQFPSGTPSLSMNNIKNRVGGV